MTLLDQFLAMLLSCALMLSGVPTSAFIRLEGHKLPAEVTAEPATDKTGAEQSDGTTPEVKADKAEASDESTIDVPADGSTLPNNPSAEAQSDEQGSPIEVTSDDSSNETELSADATVEVDEPSLPGGITAESSDSTGENTPHSSHDHENKGHEAAWSALGLFEYIMSHSRSGSAEHDDAALALEILRGTDSLHTRDIANTLDLACEGSPASLMNMKASLSHIDSYNRYRAQENREEGTNLSTSVGTNCTILAISIVQCSYSSGGNSHSSAFSVSENLAWGYDPEGSCDNDPFQGWYEKEKEYYKETTPIPPGCSWDHYRSIVNPNTVVTGFAQSTDNALQGICHEQTFSSGSFTSVIYTTQQFRTKWFNRYYANMRAEGMGVRFDDLPESHWGHWVVRQAVGSGFMNGYSGGAFGPNDNVTRGQVATILWNRERKPQPLRDGRNFTDVTAGKYYSEAVAWASDAGIVNGYADGRFGPDDNVTREQLSAMLRNYAKYKGLSLSGSSATAHAGMADAGNVSAWAASSVGWCFSHKLLSGSTDGKISPKGYATRAQVAKMVVMLNKLK